VDKLISIAEFNDIAPVLIIGKCDLAPDTAEELKRVYELAGYPVFLLSATEGAGVDALRTYLACNMGATQAAAKLYVHRSTLLERLTRIRRELGLDLDDPDTRLRLELLLKAMEVRDTLMGVTRR
jgi:50S ribosomal subunit-associated GTPase HflX